MTLREAITQASTSIARRDAETLLLHLLGRDRPWLLAHPDDPLSPEQEAAFHALATRRAAQEPLQYITGHQEFFGLDLHVAPGVLVPRPETEVLVEAVLNWAHTHPPSLHIADIGTGSGAIALALAANLPHARITALDLSPTALAIAKDNAARLNFAGRIRFLESDLLDALQPELASAKLDAVVSNPPYVPTQDALSLQPEVRDFEPHSALFAGADGLAVYRNLIPEAHVALRPGGLLAMEFGFGQREFIALLLSEWQNVRFLDDLAGIPRVALAERA